jgi:hypothetical protein
MMRLVLGLDLQQLSYRDKNFVRYRVYLVELCCMVELVVIWVLL